MTVFLSFVLSIVMAGIVTRHRPFYQAQLVLAGLITILTISYFYFGMI